VYYKRKKTGTFYDKDYYFWEREFLDKMVSFREIQMNPSSFMVNLDFTSFTELIDIRPHRGSPFILSMSEPYTEEALEAQIFRNWIEHFGLKYFQLHASGHIGKNELESVIKRIAPKKVFPVHTEHPEMFEQLVPGVIIPEKSREYDI
jgi:ribonuclease J